MNPPFWRIPNWSIRVWAGLALLALLLMEGFEFSLWYQAAFSPGTTPWAEILVTLFTITGASLLLARGMDTLHWKMFIRQAVLTAWVLLVAFASLKLLVYPHTAIRLGRLMVLPLRYILGEEPAGVNFYHVVGITMLVWRGVALARGPVMVNAAQGSFQFGLILVLLYGMIYGPLYPVEATIGLFAFLLFGLLAMSAARIASLSELRGGRIPRFGLGWFSSIGLAGLTLVGLAILLGWLISRYIGGILAEVILILLSALTALALFLFSPLLWLFSKIAPLLTDLLMQVLARLQGIASSVQNSRMVQLVSNILEKLIPVANAGRAIVLAGLVVIVLLAAALALRLRKIRQAMIAEEDSSIVSTEAGRNPLRRLLQRLARDARQLRLRTPAQVLAAARIRMIYRQLMALSQKMGAARPPSTTPLEFLPRLEALIPEEREGLGLITGAYLRVRYGLYPEDRRQVEAVEAAWTQVRRKGRQIIAASRR